MLLATQMLIGVTAFTLVSSWLPPASFLLRETERGPTANSMKLEYLALEAPDLHLLTHKSWEEDSLIDSKCRTVMQL